MAHKPKPPSQASGQADKPSKVQQQGAKGAKYPWETAESAAKRLAKKLNPFD